MLLFYVRHGDPIYDPDSLTERGHRQADALVERMKRYRPDRVFASPSNRAMLTAKPTAEALGKPIEVLDWCNEAYAFGEFSMPAPEGGRQWYFQNKDMTAFFATEEIRRLDKEWYTHPRLAVDPCGDGIRRITKASDEFFASLGYRHDHDRNGYIVERPNDDRIAIFAHQGFGLAFLSCLLDIPYPQICTRFDFGHSGVTVIQFSGKDFAVPKVLQWSSDSHLFAAGVETAYQNEIDI